MLALALNGYKRFLRSDALVVMLAKVLAGGYDFVLD